MGETAVVGFRELPTAQTHHLMFEARDPNWQEFATRKAWAPFNCFTVAWKSGAGIGGAGGLPYRGLGDRTRIPELPRQESRLWTSQRYPAVAVDELLLSSPRCLVDFGEAGQLVERLSELVVDLVGAIAHHFETAAARRTRGAKRGDDNVPAGFESMFHSFDVTHPRLLLEQEMEDRAIVPESIRMVREPQLGDVA